MMNNISSDFDKRINFGNYEANIRFLNETDLINKQTKILEIGSGTGSLLNFLYKKGYDIRGVETNEKFIKKSKELYGNLPLNKVSSEVLPFPNGLFDVVISFDVFEHIPDSDRHLQEVYRVLNRRGFYLLQTPNRLTNTIFETIRWKSFTKWREDHYSLHSYWEIKTRFDNNGFTVEFYDIPIVTDFFKLKIKRYLGNFGIFLLRIINPDKFPIYLKTDFYIKAKKKAKSEDLPSRYSKRLHSSNIVPPGLKKEREYSVRLH